jgi:gamma-D-glutamyl-L-lysine dipeptidyl-peptidase
MNEFRLQLMVIVQSTANMRSEPRHAAELVSQVGMGQQVSVTETSENKWHKVTSPDGYQGWLEPKALVKEKPLPPAHFFEAVVIAHYTTLLQSPESHHVVGNLVMGNLVMASPTENGFHVLLPDGTLGYLPKGTLMPLQHLPEPTTESVMDLAREFIGVPYLWGGSSPRGFDCSGLVQFTLGIHGVNFPRDARQQAEQGTTIAIPDKAINNLQPADLLFFGEIAGKITHVALYLGQGLYIHASGMVQINSLLPDDTLFEPYRYDTWQSAKRVI